MQFRRERRKMKSLLIPFDTEKGLGRHIPHQQTDDTTDGTLILGLIRRKVKQGTETRQGNS